MRLQWILLITVLFTSFPHSLQADVRPSPEIAEQILKVRLEELKKESIHSLKEGKQNEMYDLGGLAIQKEALTQPDQKKSGGGRILYQPKAIYRLEYIISPLLGNDPAYREVIMAVRWEPNPSVKQTQTLRLKTYISEADTPPKQ